MFVSGDQRIILTQPCSTEFGNGGFLALLNHFTVLRSSDQNQSVSYRFQSSGRWAIIATQSEKVAGDIPHWKRRTKPHHYNVHILTLMWVLCSCLTEMRK